MARQEEADREKDEPDLDEEMTNEELEDEEDEIDEDEEGIVPQSGEIEHGEKSREGGGAETDDRVAWRPEDEEEPDRADRRR